MEPVAGRDTFAFTNVAKDPIQNAVYTAINVDSGKVAWQYKAKQAPRLNFHNFWRLAASK